MEEPQHIGDWKKIGVLGSGAFGIVVLWKHNETNEFIAVKKCKFHKQNSLTAKQKKRWTNEVEIMKTIEHPNIIRYKQLPNDFETDLLKYNPSNLLLLPMEYCSKGNLRHMLRLPKNFSGLPESDVRFILMDICQGLAYLHTLNITHRDIKPENIVLQPCDSRPGTNVIYKIIDLGYAKDINNTIVSFVGTLHYLAPEIFRTEQYDCSVDYWSLGSLAFEVICGVLPFLPQCTPVERFEKIKSKSPDDICIYISTSGSITYSAELKRENYISDTLKQHLEIWLRHVLQYDPKKRAQKFPNNVAVLDYLSNILRKNIVKVFSVYKLEFYSYEIDTSTALSTLKSWISRDTKIPIGDLILITNNNVTCRDDTKLIQDLTTTNTVNDLLIIVYKKQTFFSSEIVYNFPKLIRDLFNVDTFQIEPSFAKQFYSNTIYSITREKWIFEMFFNSFATFSTCTNEICDGIANKFSVINETVSKFVKNVRDLNEFMRNNLLLNEFCVDNGDYISCANRLDSLLSNIERSVSNFYDLKRNVHGLTRRKQYLVCTVPTINKVIEAANLSEQLSKTISIIMDPRKDKNVIKSFKQIISNTIRIKDSLLNKNKEFQQYTRVMSKLYNTASLLARWMEGYHTHLLQLTKLFAACETSYNGLVKSAITKRKGTNSISTDCLVEENCVLRNQWEAVLSRSIEAHEEFKHSTNAIFPIY